MTNKKSTAKRGGKGTTARDKGKKRLTLKDRARAIVADESYDDDTRNAIKNSLADGDANLAELVRRAEAGEIILDTAKPLGFSEDRDRAVELLERRTYYGSGVEAKLRDALEKPEELRRLLAAIDAGERKASELLGRAFDEKAVDYAFTAYSTALEHYYEHQGDSFALSRLAVVYDEQQPGDFNMVVTLPGHMRDRAVTDEELRGVIIDAERIARTLEDPDCSEAYRKAFGSIFTDHLFNVSNVGMEHPTAVRVLLPLLILDLWRSRPANADTTLEILSITLRDTLNSDEVSERTRVCAG